MQVHCPTALPAAAPTAVHRSGRHHTRVPAGAPGALRRADAVGGRSRAASAAGGRQQCAAGPGARGQAGADHAGRPAEGAAGVHRRHARGACGPGAGAGVVTSEVVKSERRHHACVGLWGLRVEARGRCRGDQARCINLFGRLAQRPCASYVPVFVHHVTGGGAASTVARACTGVRAPAPLHMPLPPLRPLLTRPSISPLRRLPQPPARCAPCPVPALQPAPCAALHHPGPRMAPVPLCPSLSPLFSPPPPLVDSFPPPPPLPPLPVQVANARDLCGHVRAVMMYRHHSCTGPASAFYTAVATHKAVELTLALLAERVGGVDIVMDRRSATTGATGERVCQHQDGLPYHPGRWAYEAYLPLARGPLHSGGWAAPPTYTTCSCSCVATVPTSTSCIPYVTYIHPKPLY